jgi:hypothetical protein
VEEIAYLLASLSVLLTTYSNEDERDRRGVWHVWGIREEYTGF